MPLFTARAFKTLARLASWPVMWLTIPIAGLSGSYIQTAYTSPLKYLAIGVVLIAPPVLVALVFNPLLRKER